VGRWHSRTLRAPDRAVWLCPPIAGLSSNGATSLGPRTAARSGKARRSPAPSCGMARTPKSSVARRFAPWVPRRARMELLLPPRQSRGNSHFGLAAVSRVEVTHRSKPLTKCVPSALLSARLGAADAIRSTETTPVRCAARWLALVLAAGRALPTGRRHMAHHRTVSVAFSAHLPLIGCPLSAVPRKTSTKIRGRTFLRAGRTGRRSRDYPNAPGTPPIHRR
jgi:hypothetical protein